MVIIFYTGSERLSVEHARQVRSYGNVFLQTSRGNFTETISTVVTAFETSMHDTPHVSMETIPEQVLNAWCIMYCGGSKRIMNDLKTYSKDVCVAFHYELFDW
jgi:hypothetical protein